jgi:hypothetical protein
MAAPQIDRVRLGLLGRARPHLGELAVRHGLDVGAAQTMGMLRNLMPDRSVPRDSVVRLFRYQPAAEVEAAIDACAAAGVVEVSPAGDLGLAGPGREFVTAMMSVFASIADEMWASEGERIEALLPLVEQVVAAAAASGGPAFSVVWPVWRPPGVSRALLLAELLTPMRFHRFEAHIDAWTAAGLTVEQVTALEPGEMRDAIERDTNRAAAVPYESLGPDERAALVAGLELLPV